MRRLGDGESKIQIWHFPGLSQERLSELLNQNGLQQCLVACADREGTSQSTNSQAGGTYSAGDGNGLLRGSTNSGSTRRKTREPRLSSRSSPMKASVKTKTKTAAQIKKSFACPFPKHSVARYADVHNACTSPPGIGEFKRVKEHIKRCHSPKEKCPRCNKKWQNPENFETEFQQHKPHCPKLVDFNEFQLPEPLDARQVEVLKNHDYRGTDGVQAWKILYQDLFPDAHSVPSPCASSALCRCQSAHEV